MSRLPDPWAAFPPVTPAETATDTDPWAAFPPVDAVSAAQPAAPLAPSRPRVTVRPEVVDAWTAGLIANPDENEYESARQAWKARYGDRLTADPSRPGRVAPPPSLFPEMQRSTRAPQASRSIGGEAVAAAERGLGRMFWGESAVVPEPSAPPEGAGAVRRAAHVGAQVGGEAAPAIAAAAVAGPMVGATGLPSALGATAAEAGVPLASKIPGAVEALAAGGAGMGLPIAGDVYDRTGDRLAAGAAGAVATGLGAIPVNVATRGLPGGGSLVGDVAGAGLTGGLTNVATDYAAEGIARAAGAEPREVDADRSFVGGLAFGGGLRGVSRVLGGRGAAAPEEAAAEPAPIPREQKPRMRLKPEGGLEPAEVPFDPALDKPPTPRGTRNPDADAVIRRMADEAEANPEAPPAVEPTTKFRDFDGQTGEIVHVNPETGQVLLKYDNGRRTTRPIADVEAMRELNGRRPPDAPEPIPETLHRPEGLRAFVGSVIENAGIRLGNAKDWLKDAEGRVRGYSLPKLIRRDPAAGEAGVRWAYSTVAAKAQARLDARNVLGDKWGDTAFRRKLGAVLVEDNLRQDRQLAAGRGEDPAAVHTLVGPGRFFKTEAEYRAALADPEIRAAIQRDKGSAAVERERAFRAAAPDAEGHPGGLETGVHISLKALQDATGADIAPSSGMGGDKGKRRTTSLARQRKGTGADYELDYARMLEHSYTRNYPVAHQREFYAALTKSGQAKETSWKDRPRGPEWSEKAITTREGRLVFVDPDADGPTSINQNKYLWVKKDVADEVKALTDNLGGKSDSFFNSLAGKINAAQLAVGLSDNINHNLNLFKALTSTPGIGSNMVLRKLGGIGGVPKVFVALDAVARKALAFGRQDPGTLRQARELAGVGAMRDMSHEYGDPPKGLVSKVGYKAAAVLQKPIEVMDRASRLALDDAWKQAVKNGWVENTPQSRREWVNQVGQYNLALQGVMVRNLRKTNVAPFATAGITYNRLGVRNWLLDPGVKAPDAKGALKVRLAKAALIGGTHAQIGLLNYLLVGSLQGRPGVPWGSVDTGANDERGRPLYIPVADQLFATDRGARVVGMGENLKRAKQGRGLDLDAAAADAWNQNIRPLLGPAVTAGVTAMTGHNLSRTASGELRRVSPVVPPGDSQALADLKAAGLGIVSQVTEPGADEPLPRRVGEVLKSQAGPLLPRAGRSEDDVATVDRRITYAKRVDYADDVYRRAKGKARDERAAFVRGQIEAARAEDRPWLREYLFGRRNVMRGD